jgi:glutathione S-transferase
VPSADARADIDRIVALWRECRAVVPPSGGPFLFGHFTIADAMYAPVATRFRTYGVPLDATCSAYRDAILSLPAFLEWEAEAKTEPVVKRYAAP